MSGHHVTTAFQFNSRDADIYRIKSLSRPIHLRAGCGAERHCPTYEGDSGFFWVVCCSENYQ